MGVPGIRVPRCAVAGAREVVSLLGPVVGGPSNIERTGARDLCVSAALRRVPDVRHVDVDFTQYCPLCRKIEVVIEASADPRKASDLARRIARQLDAVTLLIIHRYNDDKHEHPVIISTWNRDGVKELNKDELSWLEFVNLMHGYHELHLLESHNA